MSISGCGLLNGLTPDLGLESSEASQEVSSSDQGVSSESHGTTVSSHSEPTRPSEPTQPSEPESHRDRLQAPVFSINPTQSGLYWPEIDGAYGYEVNVSRGDTLLSSNIIYIHNFEFPSVMGGITISVRAKADISTYDSDWSEFIYVSKFTTLDGLTYNNGTNEITWANYDGKGLDIRYGDGGFNPIPDESLRNLRHHLDYSSGIFTVRSRPGLSVWNNNGTNAYTYYVENPQPSLAEKTMMYALTAANPETLIDGSEMSNEELQDKWVREYYGASGWTASATANIELTEEFKEITQSGKCAKLTYHLNGNAFRFSRYNIPMNLGYNTLSADVKGDGIGNIQLVLIVDRDYIFQGVNLRGCYATFDAGVLTHAWTHYDISMKDENWRFHYGAEEVSLPTFVYSCQNRFGVQINDTSEFLQCFSTFAVILQNRGTAGTTTSNMYVDNLNFNNSNRAGATGLESPVLQNCYVYKTDSIYGYIFNDGTGKWYMTSPVNTLFPSGVGAVGLSFAAISMDLNIYSLEYSVSFSMFATSSDLGWSYSAYSVASNDAIIETYLSGFKASAGGVVDKFNYTEQGQGYDQSHSINQVTNGLRASYFADYNTGSTVSTDRQSPFGGTWALMGSNDYLLLDTENGHYNPGCAKLKVNGSMWMRYSTFGVINGTATAWPKAKKFSIWINNPNDTAVSSAYLRLFTKSNLEGNIEDGTLKQQISIPANSDWFEITVDLNPNKTYYGFSIALGNTNALGGKYILIDDACVYSNYNLIDASVERI